LSDHYYTQRPNSQHDIKSIKYKFADYNFNFSTDAGVFSKDRIDPGTDLLLSNLKVNENDVFLDLGCGYGVVGVIVGSFRPQADIYMVDVNERACDLAKKNLKENGVENAKVFLSDGLEAVKDVVFDVIATNPPIRAGKSVIYKMAENSYERLKPKGRYYAVIRTSQGADSMISFLKSLFENVEVVGRKSGYKVICATK